VTGAPRPGRRILGRPSKTACRSSEPVGCSGPCRSRPRRCRHITPCLILPIGPVVRKYDVIHKTGSTQRIATASQEDRVTATGKTQKNGEVRQRGFRVVRADRQTDRHKNRHTHHKTSQPYWSEVITCTIQRRKSENSCTSLQTCKQRVTIKRSLTKISGCCRRHLALLFRRFSLYSILFFLDV